MLKAQIITLFSQQRLQSYNNDLDKHFENLDLVAKLTPKLATIEIALRNKINSILSQENTEWLSTIEDQKLLQDKQKILTRFKNAPLNHHQILSSFTLGSVIYLIKLYKLQRLVLDVGKINFRAYFEGNKNYYLSNTRKKIKFKDYQKTNLILSLLSSIRNRAYHWENLSKIIQKDLKQYPRLSVFEQNLKVMIAIAPNKLEVFLDDVLESIHPYLKDLQKVRDLKL